MVAKTESRYHIQKNCQVRASDTVMFQKIEQVKADCSRSLANALGRSGWFIDERAVRPMRLPDEKPLIAVVMGSPGKLTGWVLYRHSTDAEQLSQSHGTGEEMQYRYATKETPKVRSAVG